MFTPFKNKWKKECGIYKMTFRPFRIITYYGSSINLGIRFKYHYSNGPKPSSFRGLFLRIFGWSNFSMTVVEVCHNKDLHARENWYLSRYFPLLNVLTISGVHTISKNLSVLTRSKMSATLIGRKESEMTRKKKSMSRIGILNPFFKIGPGKKALDAAAEKIGKKVYV